MKKFLTLLLFLSSVFALKAQVPPSNMYSNLGVYKSVAVYEDGEQVSFNGVDYFYVDYDDDDVYVLFWNPYYNQWQTDLADFVEKTSDYSKYTVYNPDSDELTFIISPDLQDIMVSKEYEDIVVAYALVNSGNSHSSPSYSSPSYSMPSSGSYSSGSSSSSSGRTCVSCSGTGKCKTCDGKGWYYHETGYYVGRSGKTRTDCPVCRGTGRCGTCHGNGTIR